MRAAQQLLQILLTSDPKSAAKLDKQIEKAEQQIREVTEAKGWPEDLEGDGPGVLAVEMLEKTGAVERHRLERR